MSKSNEPKKSFLAVRAKAPAFATTLTAKLTATFALAFSLTACAPPGSPVAAQFAEREAGSVGCTSFEDTFWDGLYHIVLQGQDFPTEAQVREAFDQTLETGRLKSLSTADKTRIREELTELYGLLALDSVQTLATDPQNLDSKLETLTSLEMGDRTTDEKVVLQEKIRAQFARIESIAAEAGAPSCENSGDNSGSAPPVVAQPTPSASPAPGSTPEPTPAPAATPEPTPATMDLLSKWKASRHPAVYGGLKGLATAYQSCEAGVAGAMTSATADVEGISIIGTHPNGVGKVRVIGNLSAFLKSHYYLSAYKRPSSSCFDVQKSPLLYDYGGKPYTSDATDSTLDLFRNAGSGSSALGIDCSGYVYSALATGGLKLKKSGRLKAIGVHGVSSSMFMNPQSNGLTCLDYAKFNGNDNIRPGDILASSGHVILIESVGSDPLGIERITKESDCTSSNMSVSRFNFTILQSSPSKGGIGINRMRAADYLAGGGSMKTAMLQHAVNACLAKFRGTTITTKSSSANLIRHAGTPDCVDTAIKYAKEECVASCQASAMLESLP